MSRWSLALTLLAVAFGSPALADPPRLRVLTYNIHHAEGTDRKLDLERIARVITEARPDLVALQEVDVRTKRTGGVDQAAKLGELTKMHVRFGAAMPYDGGEYGNAILSRWPLEHHATVALEYDKADRIQEPRCALVCRTRPDGLPEIAVASTHLCHRSPATREKQVRTLMKELQGLPPPVLAGDFNARGTSPAIQQLLKGGWADATATVSVIDYVLVRDGDPWRVVEARTLDEAVASDHRPVLAVLEWAK